MIENWGKLCHEQLLELLSFILFVEHVLTKIDFFTLPIEWGLCFNNFPIWKIRETKYLYHEQLLNWIFDHFFCN